MLRSLGQSWPQSTTSLQSQEHCLTVTAPFPARSSSSDEDSSSSLLSIFTTEFVARGRLAAAQERATEQLCQCVSHTNMVSGSQEGPICTPDPRLSPLHPIPLPAIKTQSLKICTFLKAGLQQIRLICQNISDKFLLDSASQHLPHQLHPRSIPTSDRGH